MRTNIVLDDRLVKVAADYDVRAVREQITRDPG
jgi:hypothetical protein